MAKLLCKDSFPYASTYQMVVELDIAHALSEIIFALSRGYLTADKKQFTYELSKQIGKFLPGFRVVMFNSVCRDGTQTDVLD